MRAKKLLSFITAAAIAASAFTGLALSASAESAECYAEWVFDSTSNTSIGPGAEAVITSQNGLAAVPVLSNPTEDKSYSTADAKDKNYSEVLPYSGASHTWTKASKGSKGKGFTLTSNLSENPGYESYDIYVIFSSHTDSTASECVITSGDETVGTAVSASSADVVQYELAAQTAAELNIVFDSYQPRVYYIGIKYNAAVATPEPTAEPPVTELQPMNTGMRLVMDDYVRSESYAEKTLLGRYMQVYADGENGKTITIANSSKTINDYQYASSIKLGGTGSLDPLARVIEVLPESDGTLTVDFMHASSSGTRVIAIDQNGSNIGTQEVEGSETATITVPVSGGSSVYIYSKSSGLNIYGIIYIPEGGTLETPEPTATTAPTQTPAPTQTTAPTAAPATAPPAADLTEMTEATTILFDDYIGNYSSDTIFGNYVKLYAATSISITASKKTIGGVDYTSTLKLGGTGSFSGDVPVSRVLEVLPKQTGKLTVAYAHAGSGDPRELIIKQDSTELGRKAVSSGGLETLEVTVFGGDSVYIYSASSGINIYGIIYEPEEETGDEPTLAPGETAGPATPKPLDLSNAQADYDALQLNSLSQTAIYFDIDLDKSGENGSTITWESSNPDYIDIQMISSIKRNYTGVVTRPVEGDPNIVDGGVPVTLTATITKGTAELKKEFHVSVRTWNPNVYWNDFQADVGQEAEGTYQAISDNVTANNGSTFRGIKVNTLKESRCFADFDHQDQDTPTYFDKRIMATDAYGQPADSENYKSETAPDDGHNYALYLSEYNAYQGGTTYTTLWINLIDPATQVAPEGIVMMSMDIYVADTANKLSLGFETSGQSQMCRFTLGNGTSTSLGYNGSGYLRYFSDQTQIDFLGGTSGYRHPYGKWVKAILVANADTHKWDFYYDGMQIASNLDFRNAEDCVSTIEFTMDRGLSGGAYLFDNIYVENLTEDYANTYWDEVGITSIPYDEAAGAYIAEAGVPFLVQYQGTSALAGNRLIWSSSNKSALPLETKKILVDALADYGYTADQIQAYKALGYDDVPICAAKPANVTQDTTVTLTAQLAVGEYDFEKEFTVLIKANSSTDAVPTATPTAKPVAVATSGGGGGGGSASSSGSAGGGIATSLNTSGISADTLSPQATKRPEGAEVFEDLVKTEWARDAILYLYSKDIVDGYGDGTFGVNDSVTREQFVKILLTAFNLPIYRHEVTSFSDVQEGTWYEHYVETALRMGIVNGLSDTEFGVGKPISRQDIAVMCMRVFDLVNSGEEIPTEEELDAIDETEEPEAEDSAEAEDAEAAETEDTDAAEEELSEEDAAAAEAAAKAAARQLEIDEAVAAMSFGDNSSVSDYAIESVARMAAKGYVTGDDFGNFNPVQSSTRAEAATMIYRMIK